MTRARPLLLFLFLGGSIFSQSSTSPQDIFRIVTGAERTSVYLPLLRGKAVAIFANQTSTIGTTHLVDSLLRLGVVVKKIFAPEHGFRGLADAGEKVNDLLDARTGIPIVSLYGAKQKPTPADLAGVDILLFDIQDVGVRFYTYIASLQKFMEAAIENNRPLIILDRPDPNGFYVDGPVLDLKFRSFVGMQPVPIVYGMTLGEYALMLLGEHWLDPAVQAGFNTHHAVEGGKSKIDSLIRFAGTGNVSLATPDFQLFVVPCHNYSHSSRYLIPIKPSPNLPNMQAVYLYPSLCLFEGTAISVGRGTDKPFQQFGSPFLPSQLYSFLPLSVEGAKNPPFVNRTCYGYDLSRVDLTKETDSRLQVKWLIEAYRLCLDKDNFFLTSGFFNKLAGNEQLMEQIKKGETETEIRRSWEPALSGFKTIRKKYLLYADFT
jgi:uncharacterized protein YbbC (DUF1343 family)